MVDIPNTNLNDPISLADWLELTALEAGDGNASIGDLLGVLKIPSDVVRGVSVAALDLGDPGEEEVLDDTAMQVMLEVERRVDAADTAYPFSVGPRGVLQLRGDWRRYRLYVFCLCLSYLGGGQPVGADLNPYHLFEYLSCAAARRYIDGQVFPFGAACVRGERRFENAINQLCLRLGEGREFSRDTAVNPQDDGVDLVVWKPFKDGLPSKLVMFGQCAGGGDWRNKLTDLKPTAVWENWMLERRISPLIESFYVPHRIDRDKWRKYARMAGIIFDRCRIAALAQGDETILSDDRYVDWCKQAMPTIGAA